MGAFVSANDMLLTVRRLTNTETLDEANAFVDDAELLAYLNGYLAELYDLICENHDDDFYRSAQTVNLASGQTVYPLLADFYKIISVDMVWNPTIIRPAKRFGEAERDRFKYLNPTWSYLTDIFYRTVGDNIEFQPTPQAGITAQVNYIPAFTPLVALVDTFESFNQWHWYALWGVASDVFTKDDNPTNAQLAMAKKEMVKARVIAHASTRNDGEPAHVNQVRFYSGDGGW